MSDDSLNPELPVVQAIPCRHLRSKGMYVYTDGSQDHTHEDYDSSIYWCLQTMKGFGPDDDQVHREDCCNSSRSCYEPT
jgi:hypothetical protein